MRYDMHTGSLTAERERAAGRVPGRGARAAQVHAMPPRPQGVCACGGGCPRCTAYSGKDECSPISFGSTEFDFDAKGENLTGRLIVTINDAAIKSPCVRECVKEHEDVHLEDFTPVVKKLADCDRAAGNDDRKKGECNAMANRELNVARAGSECRAYRRSFTCLTLKVLDPDSPCSKSPDREEVQKHRVYESCELKKHCAEAGTPAAGIPNA